MLGHVWPGDDGVDDPCEVPTQAELVVDTGSVDLETASDVEGAALGNRGEDLR
jgi:hypothetical protein